MLGIACGPANVRLSAPNKGQASNGKPPTCK